MKKLYTFKDPEEGTTDADGVFHPTKPPVKDPDPTIPL